MPTKSQSKRLIEAIKKDDIKKILRIANKTQTTEDKILVVLEALTLAETNDYIRTAIKLKPHIEQISSEIMPKELLIAAKGGQTSEIIKQLDKIPNTTTRYKLCGYVMIVASINEHYEAAHDIQKYAERDEYFNILNILRN